MYNTERERQTHGNNVYYYLLYLLLLQASVQVRKEDTPETHFVFCIMKML